MIKMMLHHCSHLDSCACQCVLTFFCQLECLMLSHSSSAHAFQVLERVGIVNANVMNRVRYSEEEGQGLELLRKT
jgi:hypothetical protein